MHPLAQKIATIQRRLAFRRRAVAVCWTAAALLAAALLLGLADYMVRFRDAGLRIMATTALTSVAVWAVYRWWYLPSRRHSTVLAVARSVDAHFPQLNDSLASSLEFLQQSEHDHTAGSAQLRRLVVAETTTAIDGLPIEEVIDRRPLRRASAWLVAAGAAVALCVALDAGAVGTALARLAAPLGSTQWPRQHHLAFRDPPSRLAAGQTFEVELVDRTGELPEEVRIEYRTAHGARREAVSEPMTRVGDVMVARRENIRQSFAFRATGGDDDTMRWHLVEVVEAPQLKSLSITVHPPAYTALTSAASDRHLEVLAGTGIEISGTATEPLGAAKILLEDSSSINATIAPDSARNDSQIFHVAPKDWVAAKSGQYRLELADSEGLAGVVGQWNLRVEPDPPPSASWQRPSDDLYVTANAVVPIELVVKDNLAIQRVELKYDRSDWSEAERERESAAARIELHCGADKPVPQPRDATDARGESRVVGYSLDLAPLGLPVGAEISIEAEAADYRPGIGRTVGPRRIAIITADELDVRLADRQLQIARQLERALAIEQATREDVRRVEIQHQDAGSLTSGDRNALQSAEMNQRRVGRMLVDPVEGIPALIDTLLSDIEINRVARPDLNEMMVRLTAELDGLSAGPLSVAERELTDSRKAIEAVASQAEMLSRALSTAGASQDEVISTLERLVSELSGKADYRRFARLLTELREDQLAHEKTTRAEIGVETLPLRLNELTRAQRASLNKAAASQTAFAARFGKIERAMDRLAQELSDQQSEQSRILADAVELARRLAIDAKMQETARDISENRIGGALEREVQIAADLQQVLDVLRGTMEQRPEQVADQLRDAEERLDELRQQLASLQEQIAQAEQQASQQIDPERLQSLNKQQQKLRNDIGQLARQLGKLQAADAEQSTNDAADRLNNQAQDDAQPPTDADRPSSSSQVQKAEQDLEKAAQQLAERRQQAEDDLALEIVRRFQAELTDMVERQRKVLEETTRLHDGRRPNAPLNEKQLDNVSKLAAEERALAELAKEHSELLVGLGAVRVSLEEAERRLATAAALLDGRETGSPAQQAEQLALARLEGMMEAFAQTANEAAQNQAPQPGAPAGAGGEQPQRRPTFELLEVKMLRMLQVDLHERTRQHQSRIAGFKTPLDERQQAELQQEANDLAAEQGRLAELVENMLARNNEEDEQ